MIREIIRNLQQNYFKNRLFVRFRLKPTIIGDTQMFIVYGISFTLFLLAVPITYVLVHKIYEKDKGQKMILANIRTGTTNSISKQ